MAYLIADHLTQNFYYAFIKCYMLNYTDFGHASDFRAGLLRAGNANRCRHSIGDRD